ncbi:hypothetical protein [Tardiphaga sp. P9-11]|uniref:hypothetical protein n=1 Tax=Tardiphaga sp. P9-11 TaxID=2024614 RepID=UPI0011F09C27|nr:hypothetical protein [Tardiphaga sp. P9-11]
MEQLPALRYNIGMKPTKSLRKQAEKAEAVSHRSEDTEHAERMRNLVEAFRAQAAALKAVRKKGKAKK